MHKGHPSKKKNKKQKAITNHHWMHHAWKAASAQCYVVECARSILKMWVIIDLHDLDKV